MIHEVTRSTLNKTKGARITPSRMREVDVIGYTARTRHIKARSTIKFGRKPRMIDCESSAFVKISENFVGLERTRILEKEVYQYLRFSRAHNFSDLNSSLIHVLGDGGNGCEDNEDEHRGVPLLWR
jgi:hypothetical protein